MGAYQQTDREEAVAQVAIPSLRARIRADVNVDPGQVAGFNLHHQRRLDAGEKPARPGGANVRMW